MEVVHTDVCEGKGVILSRTKIVPINYGGSRGYLTAKMKKSTGLYLAYIDGLMDLSLYLGLSPLVIET